MTDPEQPPPRRRWWQDFDLRDLHAYGGLALAAVGGAFVDWRITAIVLGLILWGMAIVMPRRPSVPPDQD